MNDETTLGGALCAAEGNPTAAGAASAAGKKEYVPPRMEVIPLGPQRLLATSGPALGVRLVLPVLDYYLSTGCSIPQEVYRTVGFPLCTAIEAGSLEAARSAAADDVAAWNENWFSGRPNCSGYRVYVGNAPYFIRTKTEYPAFVGVDWDAADFFARASFDNGCAAPYTGTYNGQRFDLDIGHYQYCLNLPEGGSVDHCNKMVED